MCSSNFIALDNSKSCDDRQCSTCLPLSQTSTSELIFNKPSPKKKKKKKKAMIALPPHFPSCNCPCPWSRSHPRFNQAHIGRVSGALPHHQRVTRTKEARTKAKTRPHRPIFVIMLFHTFGSTLKFVGTNLRIPPSLVNLYIANCLLAIR
jgi:hypothetical protein